MCPDRTSPPPALKDSTLDILRRLELYLSDPDVRDAMQNGTAGITLKQGRDLLHDIHVLTTDIVNGRLDRLLGAAQADNKELQAATKEMDKELKNLTNIKNVLDKATMFLEVLKKVAGRLG